MSIFRFVSPFLHLILTHETHAHSSFQLDYQDAAHVGSRFRITIPPEKGFGKDGGVSGSGAKIPPGATLYYEVRIRAKTGKLSTGV